MLFISSSLTGDESRVKVDDVVFFNNKVSLCISKKTVSGSFFVNSSISGSEVGVSLLRICGLLGSTGSKFRSVQLVSF